MEDLRSFNSFYLNSNFRFLMQCSFPKVPSRIMLFLGGPGTQGPGMIVDDSLENTMRSWYDVEKDNIPYMKKSIKVTLILNYILSML